MPKSIKIYILKKPDTDLKAIKKWGNQQKVPVVIYEGTENYIIELIDEYDWVMVSAFTEQAMPELKEITGMNKIPFTINPSIEVRGV